MADPAGKSLLAPANTPAGRDIGRRENFVHSPREPAKIVCGVATKERNHRVRPKSLRCA